MLLRTVGVFKGVASRMNGPSREPCKANRSVDQLATDRSSPEIAREKGQAESDWSKIQL